MKENLAGKILLALSIFLVWGCGDKEVSKKISLYKRSPVTENRVKHTEVGSLKFGFDLRLGPKDDVKIYLPFLRYLEQNTGNRFSLRFTEKYEDTVENLGKGIVHFAALGPASCVIAKEKYGAGCLVMGLNSEGEPEYRAVIFTRRDSPLRDIKDLKGKALALGDKYSTQGHIIPRKMLEDAGISLKDLKSYVFTGSHANTARAVLNREYDAGAIQDSLAKRLSAEGKIKIIAISKPYPSSLICYDKNVHSPIIKNMKTALLSFDPKGKHADMLVDWNKTEMPNGFTEYRESSLKEIEQLVRKYGLY
ncbi:MAG: phosphate/phosphite/phosphonate ABC transporter substrate-binding protein [Nitrospirae bacterium]|nr:phosphate/phosphite/phosphonate ABC transporter substrate-binding protein [Nitrospirota bacterium]MCL5236452.1 phosphate/phosphite/phosphonate ABC transporter substrate-binding protein [Nitrospirota bacterium]